MGYSVYRMAHFQSRAVCPIFGVVRRGQEMFCGCGRFRFVVRVDVTLTTNLNLCGRFRFVVRVDVTLTTNLNLPQPQNISCPLLTTLLTT